MKKNFKEINPELKKGDVVILLHMDGESVPIGSRGFVIEKIPQPRQRSTDSGYGYKVEWYDIDTNKLLSKFPLFPEDDGWIFDRQYYESEGNNINESSFKDVDDLVEWGNFLNTFGKEDLNRICEFFELERKSGFFNMHTEGGKFLLTGPNYIKSFIDLKSFETNFDKEDKNIHKLLLSRSQEVRDIFIRGAMKYLEEKEQELEIPNIQKTMQRLARTSKIWWMRNADKYLNKEIK
jgi:hypothetical protein